MLVDKMIEFLVDYRDEMLENIKIHKECTTIPFAFDLATMSKEDREIYDEMVDRHKQLDELITEYYERNSP